MKGFRYVVRCSALESVAVRCRVLQCVAVCCSALQGAAVRCSVLQCVAVASVTSAVFEGLQVCSMLQYVAVFLHCITCICSLHHVSLGFWYIVCCCSALQCVAGCCRVLH